MSDLLDLETRLRATLASVAELPAGAIETPPGKSRGHRPSFRWRAITAVTVLMVGTAVAIQTTIGDHGLSPALDQGALRLIVQSSQTALNSGTGHLEVRQSSRQRPGMSWSVNLSFSGDDISETLTVTTPPPPQVNIPLTTTTYGLVLVDGILYRQINGQWYAENASLAQNVLAAPTPRNFLNAIQPRARLRSLGTDDKSGWTHLRARDPAAAASALEHQVLGLGGGTITSLDLWVDHAHVVQRMSWTIHYGGGCPTAISVPTGVIGECPPPSTDSVDITFAHLGTPRVISAPKGALPGFGPFDGPHQ